MKAGKLLVRILLRLKDVAEKGATRTDLMHRFRIKADLLTQLVNRLIAEGYVFAQEDPKPYALGRTPTRYFHKDFAPAALTEPSPDDIPIFDPNSPASGYTCRQCGRAMSKSKNAGRPPVFCSPECKTAHAAQSGPMRTFLSRPMLPREFSLAARHLVAADIIIRGLHVSPFSERDLWLVVYDDDKVMAPLYVFPVNNEGLIPDVSEYSSAVVVFRDGRIVYAGQQPLFMGASTLTNGDQEPAPEPVTIEPGEHVLEVAADGNGGEYMAVDGRTVINTIGQSSKTEGG